MAKQRERKLAAAMRKQSAKCNSNAPHIVVEARAGTGKTTTLIEGLKRVKGLSVSIDPSPQQLAVWNAMEQSKDARTVCFVAFNKAIADTLKQRVPAGYDAMTMHGMGCRAVYKSFPDAKLGQYRVLDIISEVTGKDIHELRRYQPELLKATKELVGLCKMNLTDPINADTLSDLTSYYDVDLNGNSQQVFELVPRVLEWCKDVARDQRIDFNDMIWLPVVLNLPLFQYDMLLVDEAQDLNRCQQQLAMRAGKRLVFCGDPKQSIYGFAGADCESMTRLEDELGLTECGVIHLPLTVTRRCGKAIVKEAQKIVPDFEAFETNPEGKVTHRSLSVRLPKTTVAQDASDYQSWVTSNDMILCRCNAPLVTEYFSFLRQGRKANIQGRDVGQGLVNTLSKLPCLKGKSLQDDAQHIRVEDVLRDLDDWLYKEQSKEQAKRHPSDSRLIGLQDRHDCLVQFCAEATTAQDVLDRIDEIFSDKRQSGILLSSVHKAKGLEAQRVFILLADGASMPHPMAKSTWERQQEMNIKYVAITRAVEELVWVQ